MSATSPAAPTPARTRAVVVVLSSVIAVLVNVSTAVWIAAGYPHQVQDQGKRVDELEAKDRRGADVVAEINIRLARIEGRLIAAIDHPQPLRKN